MHHVLFHSCNEDSIIAEIKQSVQINYPVVLYGNKGKTFLLTHLYPDIIIVDSREIYDVRMLTGFYTFKDHDLIFTEGLLTKALRIGQKLCFKRIDENIALQQYLIPIVSNEEVYTNQGIKIQIHNEFRIFFTSSKKFNYRNVNFIGEIGFYKNDIFSKIPDNIKDVVIEWNGIFNENTNCKYLSGEECDNVCYKEINCYCNEVFICNEHFLQYTKFINNTFHLKNIKEDRLQLYQSIVNQFLKHDSKIVLERLYLEPSTIDINIINMAITNPIKMAFSAIQFNIQNKIPTLLVGSTGVGKTALIQEFAKLHNTPIQIINCSSEFDGFDLLGGFKLFNFEKQLQMVINQFKTLFPDINFQLSIDDLLLHFNDILIRYKAKIDNKIIIKLINEVKLLSKIYKNKLCFEYKEGLLLDAMKHGKWILLDEINLASHETLNLIESILSKNHFLIQETNEYFTIHQNFMLFGCMNPFGDFGKKKFDSMQFNRIEFYDFSCNLHDIRQVCNFILKENNDLTEKLCIFFYQFRLRVVQHVFVNMLEPIITGRTFCRLLYLLKNNLTVEQIYKACCLLLFTQLNINSRAQALSLFQELFKINSFVFNLDTLPLNNYILTESMKIILSDILLAIEYRFPILLQGATSVGKTSIIFSIANYKQIKTIRINNHESTDITDYIGQYVTNDGLFSFKYGPLIKAIKNGWWIILDELNLAQSDVLEALNRLLDDNNEIYITETNELIKPHPQFRLFATQNINYSGRNGLAKSFRNRFVEINFPEKNEYEINQILKELYNFPKSFINLIVETYTKLNTINEIQLSGKLTLRDILKWCNRKPSTFNELYFYGIQLFVEKIRSNRYKVSNMLYSIFKSKITLEAINNDNYLINHDKFILTDSYKSLIQSIKTALNFYEPVLLIGETGIGKTLVCEVVASLLNKKIVIFNFSENTEISDLLGHYEFINGNIIWKEGILIESLKTNCIFVMDEINLCPSGVLERFNSLFETEKTIYITELNETFQFSNSQIIATMNPAGDFGKKELTPAFRNRFTEIYFTITPEEKLNIFKSKTHGLILDNKIYELVSQISLRKSDLVANLIQLLETNNKEIEIIKNGNLYDEICDFLNINSKCNYKYIFKSMKLESTKFYVHFENKINKIARAFLFSHPILLCGPPGCGKTSLINSIASIVNKKLLRINLSENTEITDLLGNLIPQGNNIQFYESEFVNYLIEGNWIILDEINLCSQTVLEGLNSILDYRKSIMVNNKQVIVNKNTRIFGTMNPCTIKGRKQLPRSFLDRFIQINISDYTAIEIKSILSNITTNYSYNEYLSLRGNLKLNIMNQIKTNVDINKYHLLMHDKYTEDYEYDNIIFRIKDIFIYAPNINTDFVLIPSQLPQIYEILACSLNKIPIILKGNIGRKPVINFVGKLLQLPVNHIYYSKSTDISDLIGGYQKSKSELFIWKNSKLIDLLMSEGIIVLHNADQIDKSIFDRLNSLFEFERKLLIYEKVIKEEIKVPSKTIFILFSDDETIFSESILDRCHVVNLSDKYNHIDLLKINSKTINPNKIEVHITDISLLNSIENELQNINIEKFTRYNNYKYYMRNLLQTTAIEAYCNISCEQINNVELDKEIINYYEECLQFKKTNEWKLLNIYFTKLDSRLWDDKFITSTLVKHKFIESLRNKTIDGLIEIQSIIEILLQLNHIFQYSNKINRIFTKDPSLIYYNYINNKIIMEENQHKSELKILFIQKYKFNINNAIILQKQQDLIDIRKKYDYIISNINKNRNYNLYLNIIRSDDLINTLRNNISIITEFNDLILFHIASNLSHQKNTNLNNFECNGYNYNDATLQLIKNKQIRKCITQEYGKGVFNMVSEKNINGSLLIDCILNNNITIDLEIMPLNFVWFDDDDYNNALTSLLTDICTIKIMDIRQNQIILNSQVINVLNKYQINLSQINLFITPNRLINYLKEIDEFNSDIDYELMAIFSKNTAEILNYELNYKYFLFPIFNTLNEKYFYDSNVYEFIDKIKCIKLIINQETVSKNMIVLTTINSYKILKNYYYLFKAFEIEKINETKLIDANNKLKRTRLLNFNKYEKIIYEYKEKWLMQPITNVITIKYNKATCVKDCTCINNEHYDKVLNINNTVSLCEHINNILNNDKLFKQFIMRIKPSNNTVNLVDIFLNNNETFAEDYSINICKLIHIFNRNKQFIDNSSQIITLFEIALKKEVSLCYLWLIYKSIKLSINYEIISGDDIKNMDSDSGNDIEENQEKTMDDITKMDINNEYDKNECKSTEDDAYECDNDGKKNYDNNEKISENIQEDILDDIKNNIENEENIATEDNDFDNYNNDNENSNISNETLNSSGILSESSLKTYETATKNNENSAENIDINHTGLQEYCFNNYTTINLNQVCKDNLDICKEFKIPDIDNINEIKDNLHANENGNEIISGENNFDCNDETKIIKQNEIKKFKFHKPNKFATSLIPLLQSILEMNKNSKYKKGYKSGKKLDINSVINYIASGFTKDKIWMRKSKNKYEYKFNIFIDNSKSMNNYDLINLFSEIFYQLKLTFEYLNINIELFKFGSTLTKIADINELDFSENETKVDFIYNSIFENDFNIILTDGIFNCSFIRNFMTVILDKKNIQTMNKITIINDKLIQEKYLDTFGLKYCIIENSDELYEKFIDIFKEIIISK